MSCRRTMYSAPPAQSPGGRGQFVAHQLVDAQLEQVGDFERQFDGGIALALLDQHDLAMVGITTLCRQRALGQVVSGLVPNVSPDRRYDR
jgi:hypothetical protein